MQTSIIFVIFGWRGWKFCYFWHTKIFRTQCNQILKNRLLNHVGAPGWFPLHSPRGRQNAHPVFIIFQRIWRIPLFLNNREGGNRPSRRMRSQGARVAVSPCLFPFPADGPRVPGCTQSASVLQCFLLLRPAVTLRNPALEAKRRLDSGRRLGRSHKRDRCKEWW